MFKVPEKYRYNSNPMFVSKPGSLEGAFLVPFFSSDRVKAFCLASYEGGWEHVSIHMIKNEKQETPTWKEMCHIKGLFWDEEDAVIQFHPPKSEYVNNHQHTLHLWRPVGIEFPRPIPEMVGIVTG